MNGRMDEWMDEDAHEEKGEMCDPILDQRIPSLPASYKVVVVVYHFYITPDATTRKSHSPNSNDLIESRDKRLSQPKRKHQLGARH